jgi:HNH endonuclease
VLRSGKPLPQHTSDQSAYSKKQPHWESGYSSSAGDFGRQTGGGLAHVDGEIFHVPSGRAERRLYGATGTQGFVKALRGRVSRLRLEPHAHRQLCQKVLRRDGWRCQGCGRRENLEVPQTELRSHLGSDIEENLITLCHPCHSAIHGS